MSRYLVDRIASLPNVEVVTQAQISTLEGRNGVKEAIRWCRSGSAEEVRRPIRHLFLSIGVLPSSDWLSGFVRVDPKGFVLTGTDVARDRQPLETSRRGVFAVGDIRPGSVKRVGVAIAKSQTLAAWLAR